MKSSSDGEPAPISERCDDNPCCCTQILISIIKACVDLLHLDFIILIVISELLLPNKIVSCDACLEALLQKLINDISIVHILSYDSYDRPSLLNLQAVLSDNFCEIVELSYVFLEPPIKTFNRFLVSFFDQKLFSEGAPLNRSNERNRLSREIFQHPFMPLEILALNSESSLGILGGPFNKHHHAFKQRIQPFLYRCVHALDPTNLEIFTLR